MEELRDMRAEQEYTARVQQLMLAIIEQADDLSGSHSESIRAIIADAWEELRVRPTQLSVQDLEQLSTEVDRFVARRDFTRELAERYRKMLMNPFFARVDFIEEGSEEIEKIVIGLYSLEDERASCRCTTGVPPFAACITIPCPAMWNTIPPAAESAAK